MSEATISGHRVTNARVQIPAHGIWWADVSTDDEVELEGAVSIEVSDLLLEGTVVSGGPYQGRSSFRVTGGAGGWGKVIAARAYTNDAGVKLSTILADAAVDAGETLDVTSLASTDRLAGHYARENAPAGRVLQVLKPEAWYVDTTGITRLGSRAAVTLDTSATRVDFDQARGVLKLASDTIAQFLPGVVVDGLEAVDVHHELTPDTLRTTLWGNALGSTSRRVQALERLIRQLLPDYRYHVTYEYRVVTLEGERVNLQPVRVSLGMPDLGRVRVRPGVPGVRADIPLGSVVLVSFVNADPSRPVVVGFEDAEGDGFPTVVEVGLSALAVSLSSLIDSRLTDFVAPFVNTTPVPNDGGLVIQTAVKAALTTALWTGLGPSIPPSTASSNLKANP